MSKVGTLLQIGFGYSGSRIVSHNLTSYGELVPMIPGRWADHRRARGLWMPLIFWLCPARFRWECLCCNKREGAGCSLLVWFIKFINTESPRHPV